MSEEIVELAITASISSDSNSDQGILDRQAWNRLVRQVRKLAARIEEQGCLGPIEISGDVEVSADQPAGTVVPFPRLRLVERQSPDGPYERDHLI